MKKSTKLITTIMAIGASAGAIAPIALSSCSNKCTIKFTHTEGGKLEGDTTISVKAGIAWKDIENRPSAVADTEMGYEFKGWFIDETPVTKETIIEESVTIEARFEQTRTGYNIEISHDTGFSKLEPIHNILGEDITFKYELIPGYALESVIIMEKDVGPLTPIFDYSEKTFTIDHTRISTSSSTINVSATSTWTVTEYTLNPQKDDGFSSLTVTNKKYGEDIKLSYELIPGFVVDKVTVQEPGQTSFEATIDKTNKIITISHAKIVNPTLTIAISATSTWTVTEYTLNPQKGTGVSSLEVTSKAYGKDITLSYNLAPGYAINQVFVQEEGQTSITPDVDEANKIITIDKDDIVDPTKTITIFVAAEQTISEYKLDLKKSIGVSSLVEEFNVYNEDIILSYTLEDGYGIKEITIQEEDQESTITPVIGDGTITIDHTKIINPTKTIHVNVVAEWTVTAYTLDFQKGEGVASINVDQNVYGQDIWLTYTLEDGYGLKDVTIQEEGQTSTISPYVVPVLNQIRINCSDIINPTKTIHVSVTAEWTITKYSVSTECDEGVLSLNVTHNVYGEDIEITYTLNEGFSLGDVDVLETGQPPKIIEPKIDESKHTITIDKDDIGNPAHNIDVDVQTNPIETDISFSITQSEIFNYVNYEGEDNDLVATYHFIPNGTPLKAGDVITAEIVNQKHNPTPDEEVEGKEIDFYNDVDEYVVQTDGETSIPFKFISTYTGTDSHLFEVQFTLKLTITRGEEYTSDTTIENIFFENGIATTRDMFTINGTTLEDINGNNWKDPNYDILVIPKDVTQISGTAFQQAGESKIPNIKWLILDETWNNVTDSEGCKLSKIGLNAFQNVKTCRGQLYIPSSVTEIGISAFNLDSGYDNCDLVFGENSKLKKIGASAFKNTHLGSKDGKLILPQGLEVLSSQAFQNCDFTSVVIPNTLTQVDWDTTSVYGVFKNCQYLSEIDMTSYDAIPSYDIWRGKDKTFIDLPDTGTVWIKDDSLAAEWKAFFAYLGLENADNWQFIERQ